MKTYEVQYAVNTVDGNTMAISVEAAGFIFAESYILFHDDEDQTVLAVPLTRDPVVAATTSIATGS